MSLTVGSVTVDANGNETKSGEAGHLFDLMWPGVAAGLSSAGIALAGAQLQAAKQSVAAQATLYAQWVVDAVTTRAHAVVPHTLGGLQRTHADGVLTDAPGGADIALDLK